MYYFIILMSRHSPLKNPSPHFYVAEEGKCSEKEYRCLMGPKEGLRVLAQSEKKNYMFSDDDWHVNTQPAVCLCRSWNQWDFGTT